MKRFLPVLLLALCIASPALAEHKVRTLRDDIIPAQQSDTTAVFNSVTGTTRIDFTVSGESAGTFAVGVQYRVGGGWVTAATITSSVASGSRFVIGRGWDGPFQTGMQYRFILANTHASQAVREVSFTLDTEEPDGW